MRKRVRIAWSAAGGVSMIIGLSSVPDDLKRWADWLQPMDQDAARWVFVAVGFVVIALANWPRQLGAVAHVAETADTRLQHIANAREISKRIRVIVAEANRTVYGELEGGPTESTARRVGQASIRSLADSLTHYAELRARAIWVRDALKADLVVLPWSRKTYTDHMYQNPTNTFGLNEVADDLELLAHAVEERMRSV